MKSREKAIEQIKSLIALRDKEDYLNTDRSNERKLAGKKLEELIEKSGISTAEIVTNIPVNQTEYELACRMFGCFYMFPLFYKGWRELKKVMNKNACETLNEEPDFKLSQKEEPLIKDPNLESAFKKQLGIDEKRSLGLEELSVVKVLNASNRDIRDLSGIEYAYNLRHLIISENPLEDLSPIEHLGHMRTLDISKTDVKNINVLSELSFLKFLNLEGTELETIQPIMDLKLLEYVNIRDVVSEELDFYAAILKRHRIWIER